MILEEFTYRDTEPVEIGSEIEITNMGQKIKGKVSKCTYVKTDFDMSQYDMGWYDIEVVLNEPVNLPDPKPSMLSIIGVDNEKIENN